MAVVTGASSGIGAASELPGRGAPGETMEAGDIADVVAYIVTRPRWVAVDEVLIRPTEQEGWRRRVSRTGSPSRL